MIQAADLFCGAGGSSEGLARACEALGLPVRLVAINHWQRAVTSHRHNHPWAKHHCARVESLDPRVIVPGHKLDLLVAGVECTHHSTARAGRPVCDQSRASAFHVLHWIEHLQVEDVLIENVPAWLDWGPVGDDNRPIKARKGETFAGFVRMLEAMGYRVEWRVLNAADFGVPQARERLFLRARRCGRPIIWPEETHAAEANGREAWRTAADIIQWEQEGASIFHRKRPLVPNTIRRIRVGIERFCDGPVSELFFDLLAKYDSNGGLPTMPEVEIDPEAQGADPLAEPFLVQFYGTGTVRDLKRPMPTVTARGFHSALCQPFITPYYGRTRPRGLDEPLATVTGKSHFGLCEPLIIHVNHGGDRPARSVQRPLPTLTTKNGLALVTPDGIGLDIKLRMLNLRELARAQGFQDTFEFTGNKEEVCRQIGNAIPVDLAENLCRSTLETREGGIN